MADWNGVDPVKWAGNSTAVLTALLRNSVQELASEAARTIPNGGRVPVKTGNLARSVVVDNKPPTIINGPATGGYSLGLANIRPGDTIYIGWQAAYSRRMNYGFVGADSLGRVYNQSGFGFAEATAAKWPAIVQAQAVKSGAGDAVLRSDRLAGDQGARGYAGHEPGDASVRSGCFGHAVRG